MTSAFPKEAARAALKQSLPPIEPEQDISRRILSTYVPPSHARALEPDSVLVEGIRGAGKSFWWNALNAEAHRKYVASAFPETHLQPGTQVGPGYGLAPDNYHYPSKDVILKLSRQFDARCIWKAVVAGHLSFPTPYPQSDHWEDRVRWVADHPEEYDEFFAAADRALVSNNAK